MRRADNDTKAPETPTQRFPRDLRLNAVVNAVRLGKEVADRSFDAIYPERVRMFSWRYWTPIEVARRAAHMLVTDESTRVLDIGAGAGKFCLVGALTSPATFTGIEQRPHLVEVARWIADRYRVPRALYHLGDMRSVDWNDFDAFYFYNPFGEHVFEDVDRLDALVDLSSERAESDRAFAMDALSRTRIGTRVVTYYGLGGDLPHGFERTLREPAGPGVLELWIKTH